MIRLIALLILTSCVHVGRAPEPKICSYSSDGEPFLCDDDTEYDTEE